MNIVLDASAAYVALMKASANAVLSEADEIFAPDVIVPELLNARWKMARAGKAVPRLDDTLAFVRRIKIVESIEYAAEADAMASELDHPVYDCLYAALAKHADATLVTADAIFSRKARSVRTSLVGTS